MASLTALAGRGFRQDARPVGSAACRHPLTARWPSGVRWSTIWALLGSTRAGTAVPSSPLSSVSRRFGLSLRDESWLLDDGAIGPLEACQGCWHPAIAALAADPRAAGVCRRGRLRREPQPPLSLPPTQWWILDVLRPRLPNAASIPQYMSDAQVGMLRQGRLIYSSYMKGERPGFGCTNTPLRHNSVGKIGNQ
jgi:hypothetical protein